MGKMEFPPEISEASHMIAFHANLVFLSSPITFSMFFSSTRARSAGPIVKLFLVCENNFEWCRVHWEGVKGTHHHLIFLHTRKLVYFRDVIVVLHAEKQSTFLVFLVQSGDNFQIVLKERIFLRQEHVPSTMHVPAENGAWLTSFIWSALGYG